MVLSVNVDWHVFSSFFFFFNDTATTEIYTLSLHDALPIWPRTARPAGRPGPPRDRGDRGDRKSTRLNSSHSQISYAVFCLKKQKTKQRPEYRGRMFRTRRPRPMSAAPARRFCRADVCAAVRQLAIGHGNVFIFF